MQSIAVKQFLAVVPLNIQIQSLEAYHTCKIFNNFVFVKNIQTLPEFLMSLVTSSGVRWNTSLPLILVMKSPGLRPPLAQAESALALATPNHSPLSWRRTATPAQLSCQHVLWSPPPPESSPPQCSRSSPPWHEKPQAWVSSLLVRVSSAFSGPPPQPRVEP